MRFHEHYLTAERGHLYQGRFKSFPIQDDEHFLVACRYVERNALRAKWSHGQKIGDVVPFAVGFTGQLLSSWPIPRLPNWVARVNEPLSENELKTIRLCANRGAPLSDEGWVESITR